MGRLLFSLSLAVNAAVLSFLAAAVFATYWVEPGEAQEGVGLAWYFTLPGTLVVALLCAVAYRPYLNRATGRSSALLYIALVILTSLLGPPTGYVGILVLQSLHGAA